MAVKLYAKKEQPVEKPAATGTVPDYVAQFSVSDPTYVKSDVVAAKVEKEMKHKGQTVAADAKEVPYGVNPPIDLLHRAVVSVGAKRTINLGDYNSATVSVSVSLPCHKDQIDSTFAEGLAWVDHKMAETLKDVC